MGVIEFILAVSLIFCVLTGWVVGVVHVVHVLRRRYRLEREAEQREHRKQLATDFAEIQKSMADDVSFDFQTYAGNEIKDKPQLKAVGRK